VTERTQPSYSSERKDHDFSGRKVDGNPNYGSISHGKPENSGVGYSHKATTGWRPTCTCPEADSIPCTVLDPFFGSGTTGLVAERLGLDCIGVELSPDYAAIAEARLDKQREGHVGVLM
jgi:adenine-specific DNA methylase